MDEVGRLFECEEYFVPEMLLSARAMKASMELVRPLLAAAGAEPVGRVVIGTVKGDLHDIGKNLVASMLEGGGFEVIDLGADVAPERFIEAVTTRNANLVALSALLTVTMPSMKTTIDAFRGRRSAREGEDHGGRSARQRSSTPTPSGPTVTAKAPAARWRWRANWWLREPSAASGWRAVC